MSETIVATIGEADAQAYVPATATYTNQTGHAQKLTVSGSVASVSMTLDEPSLAAAGCNWSKLRYDTPAAGALASPLPNPPLIDMGTCRDSFSLHIPLLNASAAAIDRGIATAHNIVNFVSDGYSTVKNKVQLTSAPALKACASGQILSDLATFFTDFGGVGTPSCQPIPLPTWTGTLGPGKTLDFSFTPTIWAVDGGAGTEATGLFSFLHLHVAPKVTDWYNNSYTMTCGGAAAYPFTITLKDGKGVAPGPSNGPYSRFEVHVEAVTRPGDLTGPGSGETAVLLYCSPQPSNFYNEEVQIFRSDGTLLAKLPPASTLKPADSALPPLYDSSQFSISGGQLTSGMSFYAPTDSHAGGPSIHTVVTWHWDGHQFVHSPISLPQAPACPKAAPGVPLGLVSAVAQQIGNQCGLEVGNLKVDPQDPSWVFFAISPTPGSTAQGGGGIAHEVNGTWPVVLTGSALFWCSPQVPSQVVADFGLNCP